MEYQALQIQDDRIPIPELKLQLGVWQGEYQEITRSWLRWMDSDGSWIATDLEQEQRQREHSEQRADRLAEKLRSLGIDPDEI